MPKKPDPKTQQWPDCPDTQRKKVPGINVNLEDMENPCELAREWGVRLNQLRAFQVKDPGIGAKGAYKNDFARARTMNAPLLMVAGRKKKR
jgi:hypothetical protein